MRRFTSMTSCSSSDENSLTTDRGLPLRNWSEGVNEMERCSFLRLMEEPRCDMRAVKQHKKLLPPWLLFGGTIFLATLVSLLPPVISAAVAGTIKACLIHTIDT